MKEKEVPSRPYFQKLEEKILKFWKDNKILEKYLQKNDKSLKQFSFLDGPITANNPMGVHHAWGRTLKDVYQRYKNMQGLRQRFQNGFDNQGLWVEVEVEKELGFKSKKDIEKYGIARFVEKCKGHTLRFAKIQTEQSKRLGYFMDWGNDYYTMSDENNFAIWHFLKTCWQNGWLYKGEDVVPWCSRCGTAISQHEILTGDYTDITHKAIYLRYPIVGKENEYFLVWTTTPWTLLANVAVAFNPEIKYLKIETENKEILILAKDRLSVIGGKYKVLEEFLGEKLSDLKYKGPFDELPIIKKFVKEHSVISWKEGVLEEEGTGLVHISPGSGPEDYDLAKETDLPVFPVLNESGFYIKGYEKFEKKQAKEAEKDILKDLEAKGFLYKLEDFTHRYPLCWRCKTELLFRLVEEWYISMDKLRHKMMEVAKKIHWIPEFGLKLELDWLKNMEDWLISKKRYWGLCLPIWECECGHFQVIGSKEEFKEKALEGWEEFEGHSPHRPWVDKVKIKCPQCGKLVSRIPDVGNPWLDAGIVPFSTLEYFEDKDYWRRWFPADLVLECFPGQFKNWFYSLIAMSTVLENTNPFKTLLGHALVRDELGREMHKSLGNAIEFDEAAQIMGADVMRWLYVRQNPKINLNFGYRVAEEVKKRFLLIFWNCYKFFGDYAVFELGLKEGKVKFESGLSENVLDKWILSRLNRLVKKVTKSLEEYDHSAAALLIEDFVVGDLSTWYIRRSRDRIGPAAPSERDKNSCYSTLCEVLLTITQLSAPFIPFFTEEIWQGLKPFRKFVSKKEKDEDSVHLHKWPLFDEDFIDEELEKNMNLVRKICSLVHSVRREAKIRTRQPLLKLKVKTTYPLTTRGARAPWEGGGRVGVPIRRAPRLNFKVDENLIALIRKELNVKEVEFVKEIKKEKSWIIKKEDELEVSLDTRLTPELREEGQVREVIRQIQAMRKKAGLKPKHKILVQCLTSENLQKILTRNKNFILRETRSEDLKFGKEPEFKFEVEKNIKVNQEPFWLGIKKI